MATTSSTDSSHPSPSARQTARFTPPAALSVSRSGYAIMANVAGDSPAARAARNCAARVNPSRPGGGRPRGGRRGGPAPRGAGLAGGAPPPPPPAAGGGGGGRRARGPPPPRGVGGGRRGAPPPVRDVGRPFRISGGRRHYAEQL